MRPTPPTGRNLEEGPSPYRRSRIEGLLELRAKPWLSSRRAVTLPASAPRNASPPATTSKLSSASTSTTPSRKRRSKRENGASAEPNRGHRPPRSRTGNTGHFGRRALALICSSSASIAGVTTSLSQDQGDGWPSLRCCLTESSTRSRSAPPLCRPENFTEVLQLRDAGAGAVFVLLSGAAAYAAGTLDDAIADDRNRSLPHDHMAALRHGNPARRCLVGALFHLAAWTAECSRGDGLSLACIGACPYRVVHALKRNRPAAGIADRGADLDVQLLCFCQGAPKDAIGFFQGETHRSFPPPVTLMFARRRDYSARANCRIRPDAPADRHLSSHRSRS